MRLILAFTLIATALPAATAIHCGKKLLGVRKGDIIPNATIS